MRIFVSNSNSTEVRSSESNSQWFLIGLDNGLVSTKQQIIRINGGQVLRRHKGEFSPGNSFHCTPSNSFWAKLYSTSNACFNLVVASYSDSWFNWLRYNGFLPEDTKPLPESILTWNRWHPLSVISEKMYKCTTGSYKNNNHIYICIYVYIYISNAFLHICSWKIG